MTGRTHSMAFPEEDPSKNDSPLANESAVEENLDGAQPMSKRARKKAAKQAKWEEGREQRKERRKEKRAEIRTLRKEKIRNGELSFPPKINECDREPSTMGVIIDLQFQDKMIDKEHKSTAQQIGRCYAINRNTKRPVKLTFSSFEGVVKEKLATQAKDYMNWTVKGGGNKPGKTQLTLTPEPYHTVTEPTDLVYLTADSPNEIEELDETKTYVIGGIVDKNRYKNLCYNEAQKQGIATAKLPLGKYIDLKTRKVLTINHGALCAQRVPLERMMSNVNLLVFEIMIKYLVERDWEKVLLEVLPPRKGVKVKGATDDESSDEEDDQQISASDVAASRDSGEENAAAADDSADADAGLEDKDGLGADAKP
ncbi:tRNA methyltransferase 10 [Gaertneriomyces sp. JEL0708]|nr:tRNA methyltransferase 10 [Gaertneriomyces sp. JEL0708]